MKSFQARSNSALSDRKSSLGSRPKTSKKFGSSQSNLLSRPFSAPLFTGSKSRKIIPEVSVQTVATVSHSRTSNVIISKITYGSANTMNGVLSSWGRPRQVDKQISVSSVTSGSENEKPIGKLNEGGSSNSQQTWSSGQYLQIAPLSSVAAKYSDPAILSSIPKAPPIRKLSENTKIASKPKKTRSKSISFRSFTSTFDPKWSQRKIDDKVIIPVAPESTVSKLLLENTIAPTMQMPKYQESKVKSAEGNQSKKVDPLTAKVLLQNEVILAAKTAAVKVMSEKLKKDIIPTTSDINSEKIEIVDFVRTPEERMRNPDRLNLNRMNLYSCLVLPNEEQLRLLNYQNNMISHIENISELKNLVFLDFYNNQIERITALETLVNLRVLILGRNRIKKIEGLQYNTKLDVLDLHSNLISRIENLSHLIDLRVLNLEDNKLKIVESLDVIESLTELNLKKNQIICVKDVASLNNLRRLLLNNNLIESFGEIEDLLRIPHIIELSLENNPISNDPFHRFFIISRLRTLRILDNKRVVEEERRQCSKIAKKEAERRRECDRINFHIEERKRVIKQIKKKWESDVHQFGIEGAPLTSTSEANKPYIELQNNILTIYGDPYFVLDKHDLDQIVAIAFYYVHVQRIVQCLPKLKRAVNLSRFAMVGNCISRLSQINHFGNLPQIQELDINTEDNPVVNLPMFRAYALFRLSHLNIKTLCNQLVTAEELRNAETLFGPLKAIMTSIPHSVATTKPDHLFPFSKESDTKINDSKLKYIEYLPKDKANSEKLKAFSSNFVNGIISESVETVNKIQIFEDIFPKLVVEVVRASLNDQIQQEFLWDF